MRDAHHLEVEGPLAQRTGQAPRIPSNGRADLDCSGIRHEALAVQTLGTWAPGYMVVPADAPAIVAGGDPRAMICRVESMITAQIVAAVSAHEPCCELYF